MPGPCFDGSADGNACNTCSRHLEGSWIQSNYSASSRYNIPFELWRRAGLANLTSKEHHYGLCDDIDPRRAMFEWLPSRCHLRPFSRGAWCQVLLKKAQSILFVGDSICQQHFLSLVLLLDGRLGKNAANGRSLTDITASACGGAIRLNFVRSDSLLWTVHTWELTWLSKCDRSMLGSMFVGRAVLRADLVVLGLGHHLLRTMPEHEAFTVNLLKQTLNLMVKLRSQRGLSPSSVIVVGAPAPVPHCAQYSAPISLAAYHRALNEPQPLRGFVSPPWHMRLWARQPRFNSIGRQLAIQSGASYIEVDRLAARRPDSAMVCLSP